MEDKTSKITTQAAIVIGCLIIGGAYYASQINKQRSIERQQEIELQKDLVIENTKAEQAHKEYIAKRKEECFEIYKNEQKKYINAFDFQYVEKSIKTIVLQQMYPESPELYNLDDTCEISYKDQESGEVFVKNF